MKTAIILLLSAVLASGCASRGPVTPAGSGEQAEENSGYAQSLPASDMGASRNSDQGPSGEQESVDDASAGEAGNERPYTRELTLEEEIIHSGPSDAPAVDETEAIGPENERQSIDLNNTFTLQLVAMESMEGAVNYAQQYRIDPREAGVARILSQGKIYFVLAYGVYSTHTQAEQASLELQQQGVPEPWIRRLGTLERLSREANDAQPIP